MRNLSPTFMRVYTDWEMDIVTNLFVKLKEVSINLMEEDSIGWNLNKDGRFWVEFLYDNLI